MKIENMSNADCFQAVHEGIIEEGGFIKFIERCQNKVIYAFDKDDEASVRGLLAKASLYVLHHTSYHTSKEVSRIFDLYRWMIEYYVHNKISSKNLKKHVKAVDDQYYQIMPQLLKELGWKKQG